MPGQPLAVWPSKGRKEALLRHVGRLAGKKPLHVWLCAVVFVILAFIKLGSYFAIIVGKLPPAAVGGSNFRLESLGMGLVELAGSLLMLWVLTPLRSSQLVTFMGAGFLAYRYINVALPCPFLGLAPSLLPALQAVEHQVLLTASMWLFLMGIWGWAYEVKKTHGRVFTTPAC